MIEKIYYEIDEDFWCETKYLNRIVDILIDKLTGDYSIVITPNLRIVPETKYPKIVILTGDELGNFGMNPYPNQNVVAVFRIFNRIGRFDDKRIFPIPIGYNWTMHSDRTKKMVRMYPEKKISERKYDIFYSGQPCNYDRAVLVDRLNKFSNKFTILNQTNSSFRTGIPIDDYYKILGDTKIALAPDGTSVDTFRFVEAFGSGCIVISTRKDDLWYYKDCPVFLINSWFDLTEDLISYILSLNVDDIYERNLKYYKEKLSEESVASYMIEKINDMK